MCVDPKIACNLFFNIACCHVLPLFEGRSFSYLPSVCCLSAYEGVLHAVSALRRSIVRRCTECTQSMGSSINRASIEHQMETSSSAFVSDVSPCCSSYSWSAHSISVSASLTSLMAPRLSSSFLTAGFTNGAGSAASAPRQHNLAGPRLQAASSSKVRPTRSRLRATNCKADADADADGIEGGNGGGGAGSGDGDGGEEGPGKGGCGGGNGGEGFGNDGKGGSSAWRKALWAAHVGSGKSTSLARAFQRSALLGCSSARRLSSISSVHRKNAQHSEVSKDALVVTLAGHVLVLSGQGRAQVLR